MFVTYMRNSEFNNVTRRVMALFRFYNLLSRVSFCNVTLNQTVSNSPKFISNLYSIRHYCSKQTFGKCKMKVLNVAEKHDAAKNIAYYLSRGNNRKVNNYIHHIHFKLSNS